MDERDGIRVVARNRKARHDYEVLEELEAGIVLEGSEVKSLRDGHVSFADAFARVDRGEVWLHNLHIPPYEKASHDAPDPARRRKLLLNRREIDRIDLRTRQSGLTLVPLDLHFRRGYAKVTLALARGKKHRDRREDLKRRTMKREAERAISEAQRGR